MMLMMKKHLRLRLWCEARGVCTSSVHWLECLTPVQVFRRSRECYVTRLVQGIRRDLVRVRRRRRRRGNCVVRLRPIHCWVGRHEDTIEGRQTRRRAWRR